MDCEDEIRKVDNRFKWRKDDSWRGLRQKDKASTSVTLLITVNKREHFGLYQN